MSDKKRKKPLTFHEASHACGLSETQSLDIFGAKILSVVVSICIFFFYLWNFFRYPGSRFFLVFLFFFTYGIFSRYMVSRYSVTRYSVTLFSNTPIIDKYTAFNHVAVNFF